MPTEEKRVKTWDPSPFRQQHMTCWPRTHPVLFPLVHTEHWTKMKTMVPNCLITIPAAMVKQKDPHMNGMGPDLAHGPVFPPVTKDMSNPNTFKARGMSRRCNRSLQNLPQYRNEFNDRARMGFCYWPIEKKTSKCHGHSFGAYKTLLGLPRL